MEPSKIEPPAAAGAGPAALSWRAGLRALSVPALLFAFTLAVRWGYWRTIRENPDWGLPHYSLVQTTPFADARVWEDIGEDLAGGLGIRTFQGRRPLYGITLGALYAVFGVHYDLAIALNAVFSAAAVACAYRLFARLFDPLVGLVVALYLAISGEAICCAATTLTEPLGLVLLIWHFWELVLGLEFGKPGRLAFSGLLFGLSNVARPMTLLAAPGYVVLTAWLLLRARRDWRLALWGAVCLSAGVWVGVLPFMGWNYYRHGAFILSDNTAADFYGVTDPELGHWAPSIERDLDAKGIYKIKDRYDYLMAAARKNLRERPEVFWGNFRQYLITAIKRLDEVLVLASVLLIGWGLWQMVYLGRFSLSVLALLALLALGVVTWPWTSLALGAVCLASLAGRPNRYCVLLVCLLVFSVIGIAIFGSFMERLFLMFMWAALALMLGGYQAAIRWCLGQPVAPATGLSPRDLVYGPWLRAAGVATAVVFALGIAVLWYRNVWADPLPFPYGLVQEVPAARAIERVAERHPELFTADELACLQPGRGFEAPHTSEFGPDRHGWLITSLGRIDYEPAYFPGHDVRTNASKEFAYREYPRTMLSLVSYAANGNWGQVSVSWPGDVRHLAGRNFLLIGRMNAARKNDLIIEGMALVPWDWETRWIEVDEMLLATRDPAHHLILRRLVDPLLGPDGKRLSAGAQKPLPPLAPGAKGP